MKNLRVDNDYIDYFMGHTIDTYHDIQSKGVEHLRNIYAQANPAITPQPKFTPREMLEKMVRSIGLDPGRVLNREALAEPHRIHATPLQQEEEEIRLLTRAFTAYVIEQVKQSPDIPRPQNSSLPWWGRRDLNPRHPPGRTTVYGYPHTRSRISSFPLRVGNPVNSILEPVVIPG